MAINGGGGGTRMLSPVSNASGGNVGSGTRLSTYFMVIGTILFTVLLLTVSSMQFLETAFGNWGKGPGHNRDKQNGASSIRIRNVTHIASKDNDKINNVKNSIDWIDQQQNEIVLDEGSKDDTASDGEWFTNPKKDVDGNTVTIEEEDEVDVVEVVAGEIDVINIGGGDSTTTTTTTTEDGTTTKEDEDVDEDGTTSVEAEAETEEDDNEDDEDGKDEDKKDEDDNNNNQLSLLNSVLKARKK